MQGGAACRRLNRTGSSRRCPPIRGRSWPIRHSGPVTYARTTTRSASGMASIYARTNGCADGARRALPRRFYRKINQRRRFVRLAAGTGAESAGAGASSATDTGSIVAAPPTVPTSRIASIFNSSPFRTVTVTGLMLNPCAMTANRLSPSGRAVKAISPASFASAVRTGLPSPPSSEASAVVIADPVRSVTRIRTRPVCAINGEMAVSCAPKSIARRLRGCAGDSPARRPHTYPSDSHQI